MGLFVGSDLFFILVTKGCSIVVCFVSIIYKLIIFKIFKFVLLVMSRCKVGYEIRG